jgi:RNA polymerase sigma-70 factor, ECF subfamily
MPPASPTALQAFRAMFVAEFAYVCRSLRRLGVREEDLEDAAQEAFLAVHAKWSEFDAERPVRPWLFAFAFRVGANYRRKRRAAVAELSDEIAAVGASPEEAAVSAEGRTLALIALDKMDDDRRDVLVMHDLEGLDAPQIASILTIPLNTVYSRLRTARAEFEAFAARAAQVRRPI